MEAAILEGVEVLTTIPFPERRTRVVGTVELEFDLLGHSPDL